MIMIFLKLGGSLITEKNQAFTAKQEVLDRLASEIHDFQIGDLQTAWQRSIDPTHLVLGHGSGSFGHIPAKKYRTLDGLLSGKSPAHYLEGFSEVRLQAAALNHLVMSTLQSKDIPAVSFPPSASIITEYRKIKTWDISAIRKCLFFGLVPVIYGDVAIDQGQVGTVLSTEDLFMYLAQKLKPQRILLAGNEAGIFADFPQRKALIPLITPNNYREIAPFVGTSEAIDVTGGMAAKLKLMVDLVRKMPSCQVQIFSGLEPGNLQKALAREAVGTLLRAD